MSPRDDDGVFAYSEAEAEEAAKASRDEVEAAELVESDLERLAAEREDLVDALRRTQADFENYRKRVLREQTTLVERATERLIADLLPVLDSFDGALASLVGETTEIEKVRAGVEGIRSQLVAVFDRAGLERMDSDGVPFDPVQHEAVMHDDGEHEPVVAETLRSGYRLRGRVVRPAMVRVTRQHGAVGESQGGPE